MKRVLLTGATGFVGRNAIAPLVTKGYEVHAVSSRKQSGAPQGAHWHCADLLDSKETALLMAEIRPTHLLHFAWYAEPGKFWRSPENFRWLEASLALLRHFRETGGQRVVMAGTCAEYDWNYGYCTEAVTPCRPATPYGVCKNALQELLRAYSDEEKLSSAWGRIFFLYGPNEHPSRLVSSVITSLLRGDTAQCSHGNQLRDFMHVEDVASAFVALLDSEVKGSVNIASGLPIAVKDVIYNIAGKLEQFELVQLGVLPTQANDPHLLIADVARLSTEVKWQPKFDLNTGLEQTINRWKIQRNQVSCNEPQA